MVEKTIEELLILLNENKVTSKELVKESLEEEIGRKSRDARR